MRLRQAPNAIWRQAEGVLVVSLPDGDVTVIRGSAPEVWRELAVWCGEGELVDRLARRFGVEASQVRADLMPLIDQLIDRKLVISDGTGR